MECLIRNARKGDYYPVLELYNQVQEMHVRWRPDVYKHNDRLISEEIFDYMINGGNLYVALDGEKVVGICEIQYRHTESPAHVTRDVIFVDSMAVLENYRGHGVGHQFFDYLKKLKKEKEIDGIELQVNAKNQAAYEMYKAYGFSEKSINMEFL